MMPARASVLFCAALAATPAFASDIDGVWARDDGNARVRIAPCGGQICATNVWIRDPNSGEAVGDRLVMTIAKQPNGSYSGTAYDAKRGLSVSITVTATGSRLNSRGCLIGQMLCRNVNWTAAR